LLVQIRSNEILVAEQPELDLFFLLGRRFFERGAIDRKIRSTGSRQGEGGLNVNLQDRYVDGGLLPSRMLCDVDTAPDIPADFPAS